LDASEIGFKTGLSIWNVPANGRLRLRFGRNRPFLASQIFAKTGMDLISSGRTPMCKRAKNGYSCGCEIMTNEARILDRRLHMVFTQASSLGVDKSIDVASNYRRRAIGVFSESVSGNQLKSFWMAS